MDWVGDPYQVSVIQGIAEAAAVTFLGQWNSFFGPSIFLQSQDKLALPSPTTRG